MHHPAAAVRQWRRPSPRSQTSPSNFQYNDPALHTTHPSSSAAVRLARSTVSLSSLSSHPCILSYSLFRNQPSPPPIHPPYIADGHRTQAEETIHLRAKPSSSANSEHRLHSTSNEAPFQLHTIHTIIPSSDDHIPPGWVRCLHASLPCLPAHSLPTPSIPVMPSLSAWNPTSALFVSKQTVI